MYDKQTELIQNTSNGNIFVMDWATEGLHRPISSDSKVSLSEKSDQDLHMSKQENDLWVVSSASSVRLCVTHKYLWN